MSWINSAGAATPLESLLGHRPELLDRYKAFYRAIWDGELLPRRVLELCRLRIASIHGCTQELVVRDAAIALSDVEHAALQRGDLSEFTPDERAALALAGQFPFEHHAITDETVAATAGVFGSRAVVALMIALAFFDVQCRWKLAFDLAAQPLPLQQPPLSAGALA